MEIKLRNNWATVKAKRLTPPGGAHASWPLQILQELQVLQFCMSCG